MESMAKDESTEAMGSTESNETIDQTDEQTTDQSGLPDDQTVACESESSEVDAGATADGVHAGDESSSEGSDDLDIGDESADEDSDIDELGDADESDEANGAASSAGTGFPFPEDLRLEAKIEAIIFASPKPMRATEIFEILLAQQQELQEQQAELQAGQQEVGAAEEYQKSDAVDSAEEDGEASEVDFASESSEDTDEELEGEASEDVEIDQGDESDKVAQEDELVGDEESVETAQAAPTGLTLRSVQVALDNLTDHFRDRCGGFHLAYIKRMGYQFQTVPAAAALMEKQFAKRPRPISRAALETLSIIAYRQPCTRAEVEFVRGVDAGSIINGLMERGMITCVGRKEIPGRPMLFGTTDEFLKTFQLGHVKDLPSLESFQPATDVLKTAFEKLAAGPESTDVEEFIGDEEYSVDAESPMEELRDETVAEAAREIMQDALAEVGEMPRIAGASAFDEMAPIIDFEVDLEMETENGTDSTASLDFTAGPGDAKPSGELDS